MVTGAGGKERWEDNVGESEATSPGPGSGFLLGGARLETAGTEVSSACRAGHLPFLLAAFGALSDTGSGLSAVGGRALPGRPSPTQRPGATCWTLSRETRQPGAEV